VWFLRSLVELGLSWWKDGIDAAPEAGLQVRLVDAEFGVGGMHVSGRGVRTARASVRGSRVVRQRSQCLQQQGSSRSEHVRDEVLVDVPRVRHGFRARPWHLRGAVRGVQREWGMYERGGELQGAVGSALI
jgi:hypothetical protein